MPLDNNALTFRSAKNRPKSDFFPTPHDVTASLLTKLALPKSVVLYDPACGGGGMLDVFDRYGYDNWGTDLYEYPKRVNAAYGVDFLQKDCLPIDTFIITNPPFSEAEEFIRRALKLKVPFAYVLKSSYWNAAKRMKLFKEHRPSIVYALSWRPNFYPKAKRHGSPTMDIIITLWDTKPAEKTEYDILERVEYVE